MKKKLKLFLLIFIFFELQCFAAKIHYKIVTSEEPPTNFKENGEVTGIVTDIVKEIEKYNGERAEINIYPWARAYEIAISEPNVIIFTGAKTVERVEHGFYFIGPVTTRQHILYKKAGRDLKIENLEDIKREKLIVGALRGDWRGKFFIDNGIKVDEVTEHSKNLKKLIMGRIDLFALSDLELKGNCKIAGVKANEFEPAYMFQKREAYIMISTGSDPEIINQWQQAFNRLQKNGFFEKVAEKWSRILEMDLKYDKNKGIFIAN